MNTQGNRMGGLLACYHTAVSVTTSTSRGASPYHGSMVSLLHVVS